MSVYHASISWCSTPIIAVSTAFSVASTDCLRVSSNSCRVSDACSRLVIISATIVVAKPITAPIGIAVDSSGNVYIGDTDSSRVRKIDAATGIITTVAGNGRIDFSGDGQAASAASVNRVRWSECMASS